MVYGTFLMMVMSQELSTLYLTEAIAIELADIGVEVDAKVDDVCVLRGLF